MIIDLIICAVVLISAFVAFFRGFIREVLTILGVIGGLAAAYTFGESLAPFYNGLMDVDPNLPEGEEAERFMGVLPYTTLSVILGYATVFFAVVITLSIISYVLSKFIENIGMGMVDRTMGVFFGLARGMILLGVLYLPVHMFVEKEEKEGWFESSRLHIYVEWTAEWLTGFLPQDFMEENAQDKVDETRETLEALEILPGAQKLIEGINTPEDRPQSTPEDEVQDQETTDSPSAGYEEPQRKSLEDLIEEQGLNLERSGAGNE